MTQRVETLKKLQLRLTAANQTDTRVFEFAHIFGLAPEGLSPFEAALEGKEQGSSILLPVPGPGFREFFGSCTVFVQELLTLPVLPKVFELTVEIISIADADHREIVQSIAAAASHGGCGGSCGCGCS